MSPQKEELVRQLLADFKKFDRKVDGVIPASLNVETKSAKKLSKILLLLFQPEQYMLVVEYQFCRKDSTLCHHGQLRKVVPTGKRSCG